MDFFKGWFSGSVFNVIAHKDCVVRKAWDNAWGNRGKVASAALVVGTLYAGHKYSNVGQKKVEPKPEPKVQSDGMVKAGLKLISLASVIYYIFDLSSGEQEEEGPEEADVTRDPVQESQVNQDNVASADQEEEDGEGLCMPQDNRQQVGDWKLRPVIFNTSPPMTAWTFN
ncbi:unnamed protein product [marine sediment metagenome]|uniref:Uncharacterized protein n=1 Tax=marine sediment metagenome TaxID=412755 RepID=X1CP83_9ZZZZ